MLQVRSQQFCTAGCYPSQIFTKHNNTQIFICSSLWHESYDFLQDSNKNFITEIFNLLHRREQRPQRRKARLLWRGCQGCRGAARLKGYKRTRNAHKTGSLARGHGQCRISRLRSVVASLWDHYCASHCHKQVQVYLTVLPSIAPLYLNGWQLTVRDLQTSLQAHLLFSYLFIYFIFEGKVPLSVPRTIRSHQWLQGAQPHQSWALCTRPRVKWFLFWGRSDIVT